MKKMAATSWKSYLLSCSAWIAYNWRFLSEGLDGALLGGDSLILILKDGFQGAEDGGEVADDSGHVLLDLGELSSHVGGVGNVLVLKNSGNVWSRERKH